jgi:REP element-mobilizing transposase RayT
MARRRGERKRHQQQELLNKRGTGRARKRREGARPVGRPRKPGRRPEPHTERPELQARNPLHVVLRVTPEIGSLRKAKLYKALRHATYVAAAHEHMRIVHVSIQREHIHLLVEVENKDALSRGMQGFKISAAKQINRAVGGGDAKARRRGSVFVERYHSEVIDTPRRARHALAYVLNNWRKHGEDRRSAYKTDPYSTGCVFTGWKAFEGRHLMWKLPEGYYPLIVWLPQTWLLREGWKRYGPVRFDEVPSAERVSGPSRARGSRRTSSLRPS